MGVVWWSMVLVAGLALLGTGVLLGRRTQIAQPPVAEPQQSPLLNAVLRSGEDEAIRRRNAIFAKVFNLVPETLTITRVSDGRYVEVNHNWHALSGYDSEDAIGHTSGELNIWAEPEQRAAIIATIRSDGVIHNADATFVRKDRRLIYCKVSASVFESEGEAYMMLAVQDVTDQRAARQEIVELNRELEQRVQQRTLKLEQANTELEQALATLQHAKGELLRSDKLAALGALVAGVAHELNTPIGNGLTVATTLEHRVKELEGQMTTGLRKSDLDNFVKDALFASEVMVRNLTRAGDLVQSFKQVAVDRTSAQRRQFKLHEVVTETLITLNPAIRRSGCTIHVDIGSAVPMDSYPGPLGQLLDNLINNAMLHGFAGRNSGNIQVLGHLQGPDDVVLEVVDDGVGIAPENLTRIFDPFFTTRLGQGGSGLGLHIVYNIATEVLGGSVKAISTPGHGARFVVTVPAVAPQTQEPPAPPARFSPTV